MAGIFKGIQGYFDAKFGGRFFAIILSELARHEPLSFATLIERVAVEPGARGSRIWKEIHQDFLDKKLELTREYQFSGSSGNRRADLALVNSQGKTRLTYRDQGV